MGILRDFVEVGGNGHARAAMPPPAFDDDIAIIAKLPTKGLTRRVQLAGVRLWVTATDVLPERDCKKLILL